MKIPPPFERDDASNNPWNFPYEFPGFYLTRWITINFHAKTSHRAARATIQGCELNYFPPDEAYSSSASVAEEQKRHPFWFLLLRSSASNKLYIPIELQWQRFIDSYFFPLLFFFLRNAYTRSIRGDESPLVSIQTSANARRFFSGWPLFFSLSSSPAFADKFPPLLASVRFKRRSSQVKYWEPKIVSPLNWRIWIFKSVVVRQSYRYERYDVRLAMEINTDNTSDA